MSTMEISVDGTDIVRAEADRTASTGSAAEPRATPYRTPVQALRACRGLLVALPYLPTPALAHRPRRQCASADGPDGP
jgi:hypothetical protein